MTTYDAPADLADRSWRFDAGLGGALLLHLSGRWVMHDHLPPSAAIEQALRARSTVRSLGFDTRGVDAWDSSFVVFVRRTLQVGRDLHLDVDLSGLPAGVRKLLDLAAATPQREAAGEVRHVPIIARLGGAVVHGAMEARDFATFLGDACLALGRLVGGRAHVRRADLLVSIQEAGPEALWIVSLINFLVGVILAYVGSVQLRRVGAEIYVADLVGVAMVRQMGAIMTGIIMAGRTGAAYAAQLGTMRVNEEIDAVQTMGISPAEFLVLPRMLGLVVMMPLLTVYADFVGMLGGAVVGAGAFKIGFLPYWHRTWVALDTADFVVGLISASVFGVLVAICGCLRGMRSRRSSAGVGLAVTSAVVTGIISIVTADAILTVVYDALGL